MTGEGALILAVSTSIWRGRQPMLSDHAVIDGVRPGDLGEREVGGDRAEAASLPDSGEGQPVA